MDAVESTLGTNDLTQTALGMSRDDSGSFLPGYAELEIVKKNPFAADYYGLQFIMTTIDQTGVGQLMQIAIEKGRKTRPDIKLGICGEHGGEPDSVKFCHKIGLSYVSCSPYRVPVARLAAAQAAIEEKRKAATPKAKAKTKYSLSPQGDVVPWLRPMSTQGQLTPVVSVRLAAPGNRGGFFAVRSCCGR